MRALLAFGFWLMTMPLAWGYQVQTLQPNLQLRSEPDLRRGKSLQRLPLQQLELLSCSYAKDSELWCRVRSKANQTGWLPARVLDPILHKNFPLRLQDFPATLVFAAAQHQLVFQQNLADPQLKAKLRKALLAMELAMLKQRWDALHQRQSFLDISRRAGFKISAQEFQALQSEIKVLEQQFQRVLADWQRA